jgi:site-specific DNA-cytosine methylase
LHAVFRPFLQAGAEYVGNIRHLDLFSGIGGFALAAEMVWEDVEHTFCDIEPFA